MSGKCHQMSKVAIKSLIRGPNIDEKHCRPGCQRPMPPCAAIIAVHNQQWAKRWSWWWISRKKVLQGYFLLCLIDVTLMLKLLAWGSAPSTLGKKKVRAQQRTCYSRRQVANSYLQTPPSSLLSVSFWDLGSTLTFVVPLIYHQINKTLESL